jgi:tetratricopeptide (TPR) repeat protein
MCHRRYYWQKWIWLCIVFWGFMQASFSQQSANSVTPWIQQLKKNPNDIVALKGLGEACFNGGRTDIARKCFERVLKQNPNDAQALFYIGQIFEKQNQTANALEIYNRYKKTDEGNFRDRMQERQIVLKREMALDEAKKLLENEKAAGAGGLLPEAVAVLPFTVPEGGSEYEPLGKGLAEMVMTDLSQIKKLKTVERVRVQSLMDEMNLGQTGLIETSSAARFGRLLSAGVVVRGDLSVEADKKVRLDAMTFNALQNEAASPVSVKDVFERLFRIEKSLVFKVLGQMGIDPTPQEKQRILRVPTQNIQAFMAYCKGLDLEDKGAFEQAAAQYQNALDLDPGYTSAREKIKVNQILARSDLEMKRTGRLAAHSNRSEPALLDQEAMILNRHQMVRSNLGSNFNLGKDSRKPIQEISGMAIPMGGDDLPMPPAPPQAIP